MALSIDPSLEPMEAQTVSALPTGKDWRYEPKWDGFRCLAYKDGDKVSLFSKAGKPLQRYFPDIVAVLERIEAARFVIDGELVIVNSSGKGLSFEDLQLRLHPAASRVNKLAAESPATFIVFDMLLTPEGENLINEPLSVRREKLEQFYHHLAASEPHLRLSPQTETLETAESWFERMSGSLDGLMAKNAQHRYKPGERQMQKYKLIRTADCVVGGFRYGRNSPYVGSLLLGLYDDKGLLNHVGFTSSIPTADKPLLTAKLKELIQEPGFTGKAPGGPSRWSTDRSAQWEPLAPKLVAEVTYDHVTGERFRHGTKFVRWRPDKSPRQCTMAQITQAA